MMMVHSLLIASHVVHSRKPGLSWTKQVPTIINAPRRRGVYIIIEIATDRVSMMGSNFMMAS
jgi:hypothetical protein